MCDSSAHCGCSIDEILLDIQYRLRVLEWRLNGGTGGIPFRQHRRPEPAIATVDELLQRRTLQAQHLQRRRTERETE